MSALQKLNRSIFLTLRFSHKINLCFSADSASNRSYCQDISRKVKAYNAGAPENTCTCKGLERWKMQEQEKSERGKGIYPIPAAPIWGQGQCLELRELSGDFTCAHLEILIIQKKEGDLASLSLLSGYKKETSCAIKGSSILHAPFVNCHRQQPMQLRIACSCRRWARKVSQYDSRWSKGTSWGSVQGNAAGSYRTKNAQSFCTLMFWSVFCPY